MNDKSGADFILIVVYLFLVFGLPLLGYVLMVADIRAYLRALRGALVIVKNHLPQLPGWAKQYDPPGLRALGLSMPCSEQDVKRAYRQLAETMHPDRGGDRQRFLRLQEHFEEAMNFVRSYERRGAFPGDT